MPGNNIKSEIATKIIDRSTRKQIHPLFMWGLLDKQFGIAPSAWLPESKAAFKLLDIPIPFEVAHKLYRRSTVDNASSCLDAVLLSYTMGIPLQAISAIFNINDNGIDKYMAIVISTLMTSVTFAEWALNSDLSAILPFEILKDWMLYRSGRKLSGAKTWQHWADYIANNRIYQQWLARGFPDSLMPQRPALGHNDAPFKTYEDKMAYLNQYPELIDNRLKYIQELEKRCLRPDWVVI